MSTALQRTIPPHRQRLSDAVARQADEIKREYCERRLGNFVKRAWSVLEPQTPFAHEFYIDAICEHLEAINRGEIRNLVINIPPRTAKSLLSAVFWPAWTWAQAPHVRFLYNSYAEFLSRRDSRKTRTLIRSPWYQRLWGSRFQLVDDQNQVLRFDNTAHGYRIATSVGGVGTGEGGDVVAVDDPVSIMQSFSRLRLEEVIAWWDEQMGSRLNNPKTGARLIVMQRSHVNDLTGHVLKQGGYTHLMLPMEYEPSRCCYTSLRPRHNRKPTEQEEAKGEYRWDDRTREGESLSPSRFGAKEIADLRKRLGTAHAADAQLQQRPNPRGGGMVKLDWFGRYNTPPAEFDFIAHSWDTANKGGQANAYSVGGVYGVLGPRYYLLNVYRDKMNIPQLERKVKQVAEQDPHGPPAVIIIEDAASGTGVLQHLQAETALPVVAMPVKEDKVTRMDIETPQIEAGNVLLPNEAPWLLEFESEMEGFPNSEHKDQADQLSQFLKWMRMRQGGGMEEEDWNLY